MACLGSQTFTFTWIIENFSMCPQQLRVIESPVFKSEFFENTEWKLRLYPRGLSSEDSISIFLKRHDKHAQDINITYSLSVLSTPGGKEIEREFIYMFQTNDFYNLYGCLSFCYRNDIFHHESGFLPNDTLTVRCRMSKCVEAQKNEVAVLEDLKTDCWNSTPNRYECTARTRVRVSSTCFIWPIKRIDELSANVKLSTCVPSVMENERSFDLSLYLREDAEGGKSNVLEICKKNVDAKGVFVRCHIKTLGAPRNIQFQGKDEHYFPGGEKNEVWVFPTFFNVEDLTQSYFNFTDNSLYLECNFSFSSADHPLDIVSINEKFPLNIKEGKMSSASAKNFSNFYMDGEFVDATLRVRDREFKVHKLVLSAGSDVFRRAFQSGMKEEHCGIVDIVDLDPDTVERLLKYLYTDELEEMSSEDARKLYSAADKYNVGSLKCHLRTRLTASLSVDTVCETLILANLHQDEDLLESVVDYIYWNKNEIFHITNWKDFSERHGDLALRVMLQVVTRK